MKVNAAMNANNWLTKRYVIKDLIGILAMVNVNVINHAMLENIQIIKSASVEKGQLVNQLKNVVKILMRRNYIKIK